MVATMGYRSNLYLRNQFMLIKERHDRQTLLLNKILKFQTHLSSVINEHNDMTAQSKSYLSVLKLIARHKCPLPPGGEDAQRFVRSLLILFYESLASSTTANDDDDNDIETCNQKIKLALNHMIPFDQYEFNFNIDDYNDIDGGIDDDQAEIVSENSNNSSKRMGKEVDVTADPIASTATTTTAINDNDHSARLSCPESNVFDENCNGGTLRKSSRITNDADDHNSTLTKRDSTLTTQNEDNNLADTSSIDYSLQDETVIAVKKSSNIPDQQSNKSNSQSPSSPRLSLNSSLLDMNTPSMHRKIIPRRLALKPNDFLRFQSTPMCSNVNDDGPIPSNYRQNFGSLSYIDGGHNSGHQDSAIIANDSHNFTEIEQNTVIQRPSSIGENCSSNISDNNDNTCTSQYKPKARQSSIRQTPRNNRNTVEKSTTTKNRRTKRNNATNSNNDTTTMINDCSNTSLFTTLAGTMMNSMSNSMMMMDTPSRNLRRRNPNLSYKHLL